MCRAVRRIIGRAPPLHRRRSSSKSEWPIGLVAWAPMGSSRRTTRSPPLGFIASATLARASTSPTPDGQPMSLPLAPGARLAKCTRASPRSAKAFGSSAPGSHRIPHFGVLPPLYPRPSPPRRAVRYQNPTTSDCQREWKNAQSLSPLSTIERWRPGDDPTKDACARSA